jgi:hypothetical protein
VNCNDEVGGLLIMISDGAIEESAIIFEAPFPSLIAVNASNVGSSFFNEGLVDSVVLFQAFEDTPGIVISDGLLASASDSIMMLVDTHDVEHSVTHSEEGVNSLLFSSLVDSFESEQFVGCH